MNSAMAVSLIETSRPGLSTMLRKLSMDSYDIFKRLFLLAKWPALIFYIISWELSFFMLNSWLSIRVLLELSMQNKSNIMQ